MVGLQSLGPPDAGHHPRPVEADKEVSDGFLGKLQIDGVSRLRSLPCQSLAQPQSCNWEQMALCTHGPNGTGRAHSACPSSVCSRTGKRSLTGSLRTEKLRAESIPRGTLAQLGEDASSPEERRMVSGALGVKTRFLQPAEATTLPAAAWCSTSSLARVF